MKISAYLELYPRQRQLAELALDLDRQWSRLRGKAGAIFQWLAGMNRGSPRDIIVQLHKPTEAKISLMAHEGPRGIKLSYEFRAMLHPDHAHEFTLEERRSAWRFLEGVFDRMIEDENE
jgi:hypothetical protein